MRSLVTSMALLLPSLAFATTINVVDVDDAGEGFKDPTLVLDVGGNLKTTLGAQRLFVVQRAAAHWEGRVLSDVPITVNVAFDDLPCGPGRALPTETTVDRRADFPNAPLPRTLYPQALANKFAQADTSADTADMLIRFNSLIGTADCTQLRWYLGLDGNPPEPETTYDLFTVALHEIAHGLGFQTFVDLPTGQKAMDDVFSVHLKSRSLQKGFLEITEAERRLVSATPGDLFWTGSEVTEMAGHEVTMYTPSPLNTYSVNHFAVDESTEGRELLEPLVTGALHELGLAEAAMDDLGWKVIIPKCGNGTKEGPEECDDGNTSDHDCCSAECTAAAEKTRCLPGDGQCGRCDGMGQCARLPDACEDGDPCTVNVCMNGCDVVPSFASARCSLDSIENDACASGTVPFRLASAIDRKVGKIRAKLDRAESIAGDKPNVARRLVRASWKRLVALRSRMFRAGRHGLNQECLQDLVDRIDGALLSIDRSRLITG